MREKRNGIHWTEPNMIIYVDKAKLFNDTRFFLTAHPEPEERLVGKVAFLRFMREHFTNRLDDEKITRYYVAFYTYDENGKDELDGVGAISSKVISVLLKEHHEDKLNDPTIKVNETLEQLDLYFTYY